MDSKPNEIKLQSGKKNVPVRRFSYDNILDSDPHIMSRQSSGEYYNLPISMGTVPGRRPVLSSNASDPCLLSSLPAEKSENIYDDVSSDSGIPADSHSLTRQVIQNIQRFFI